MHVRAATIDALQQPPGSATGPTGYSTRWLPIAPPRGPLSYAGPIKLQSVGLQLERGRKQKNRARRSAPIDSRELRGITRSKKNEKEKKKCVRQTVFIYLNFE